MPARASNNDSKRVIFRSTDDYKLTTDKTPPRVDQNPCPTYNYKKDGRITGRRT